MALLLKISPDQFSIECTSVAKRLSDKNLRQQDVGQIVYVWFTDGGEHQSQLFGRGILRTLETSQIPQKGNSTKSTEGYVVSLSDFENNVTRPLLTDELEPFRYEPESSPMYLLGKLHENRNERIVRVPVDADAVFASRF